MVAAGLVKVFAGVVVGVAGATGVAAGVESDDPPNTPTRTTMSATNAATSATRAITTGRGARLVVTAMVFTQSLSAGTALSLETELGGVDTGTVAWAHTTRLPPTCRALLQVTLELDEPAAVDVDGHHRLPARGHDDASLDAGALHLDCLGGGVAGSERVNRIVSVPPRLLGETRIRDGYDSQPSR